MDVFTILLIGVLTVYYVPTDDDRRGPASRAPEGIQASDGDVRILLVADIASTTRTRQDVRLTPVYYGTLRFEKPLNGLSGHRTARH